MTTRFDRALPLVLAHEGGYANDPADPGGATMRGVTQATYDAWRRLQGQAPRDVRALTGAELRAIYRRQYWDAVQADVLPPGLGYALFDAAVNSGPARAARWLQQAAGMPAQEVDGVVGARTLAAVATHPPARLVEALCDRRLAFLRRLRHWPRFGRGWSRRVAEVRAQALIWAQDEAAPASPPASEIAPAGRHGGGKERLDATLRDAARDPTVLTGAGGVLGGVAAMAQGDGPMQYALAAVLVLAALGAFVLLLRRTRP
ncbi:glycoside hydrolase family 108 protein [Pseudoroseicyclus aestuarii]|uniref:Lysozyme family protein n=1 Tax=Pseudoroseicyclus aestuarii TaxID=1795041 RepID=A0A318T5Y0_9RHOB|nr:glycoside hydrolase family 108 protein [Pseudoroseicyclus aestuarii]PYE83778.1 lysozyme family protein [Pseudoroseicyclus aestuarii]